MAALIQIDSTSEVPVYRQITDGLRRHLVDGTVKPEDFLPPVRQLALDLGVHFNTVAQAYRALADEGWLDLRRRRGALVLRRDAPVKPDRKRIGQLLQHLNHVTAELRSAGLSQDQVAIALQRLAKGKTT